MRPIADNNRHTNPFIEKYGKSGRVNSRSRKNTNQQRSRYADHVSGEPDPEEDYRSGRESHTSYISEVPLQNDETESEPVRKQKSSAPGKKSAVNSDAVARRKSAESPETGARRKSAENPDTGARRKSAESPETGARRKSAENPDTGARRKSAENPEAGARRKSAENPDTAPAKKKAPEKKGVFSAGKSTQEHAPAPKKSRFKVLDDKYALHYDYKLLVTIIILCCFGLIMVYSSSAYTAASSSIYNNDEYYFLKHEAILMAAGFVLMLIISKMNYHFFPKVTRLVYFVSIILMVLTDFTTFGVEVNGQTRWINIIPGVGGPTYQPSEIVKIAIILTFAYMINRCIKNIDRIPVMIVMILLLGIPTVLVLIRNLSAAIIIAGIGCLMYFVGSRRKKFYAVFVTVVVLAVVVIYINPNILVKAHILKEYQLSRILIWKNPESDPLDKGYQILQGLYAIGSGGWFGKGLGNSVQKLSFIPESYNDMIFSIICEELGIFGALCILGLFAYLLYRCVYIIQRAPDLYGALIVTGVMIQIGLQVVFNVAVVTNSMPNTGITLPFISYGGTSVAILLAEMGMVLSVSNQIVYEKY